MGHLSTTECTYLPTYLLWAYSKIVYSYFCSPMIQRYVHANIADICTFSHK